MSQTDRGMPHQVSKMRIELRKTNEKLDNLIQLLTKFIKGKENESK